MGEYDVVVQNGGIAALGELLQARELKNPIVVTDEIIASFHLENTLASLQASGFEPKSVVIPSGEEYKNLETVYLL